VYIHLRFQPLIDIRGFFIAVSPKIEEIDLR